MKAILPQAPFSWGAEIDRALVAYCVGWLFSYPAMLLLLALCFSVSGAGSMESLIDKVGWIACLLIILFVLNWHIAPVFVLLFALSARVALNDLVRHLALGIGIGAWIALSPASGFSLGVAEELLAFGGAVGGVSGGATWWAMSRNKRRRPAEASDAKVP